MVKGSKVLAGLEGGDLLALWARAMYSGWENLVWEARIEAWGLDDLRDD